MDDEPLDNKEMINSTERFEDVYESHSRSIYKFLFWRTNDVELAEDLTSSTFEKAWIYRNNFRGGSVRAWLYKIAQNVLIDHWRKKTALPLENVDTIEDNRESIAITLDREYLQAELSQALNKLPKDMRQVVGMRFIEGSSSKQVAAKLNLSESNVRVIQYRALKKMRDYLK